MKTAQLHSHYTQRRVMFPCRTELGADGSNSGPRQPPGTSSTSRLQRNICIVSHMDYYIWKTTTGLLLVTWDDDFDDKRLVADAIREGGFRFHFCLQNSRFSVSR
jgi:hypothetical protein